jgi:hypothetical protein
MMKLIKGLRSIIIHYVYIRKNVERKSRMKYKVLLKVVYFRLKINKEKLIRTERIILPASILD